MQQFSAVNLWYGGMQLVYIGAFYAFLLIYWLEQIVMSSLVDVLKHYVVLCSWYESVELVWCLSGFCLVHIRLVWVLRWPWLFPFWVGLLKVDSFSRAKKRKRKLKLINRIKFIVSISTWDQFVDSLSFFKPNLRLPPGIFQKNCPFCSSNACKS
jgi:hypothetical protein